MLSTARTGVPQLAQREPGRTIDWPAGMRAMQTLKKLPHTAPNSAASHDRERRDAREARSHPYDERLSRGSSRQPRASRGSR